MIAAFDAVFTALDIRIIRTPVQAQGANSTAGRFGGTIRRELLDPLLIIDQPHAAAVLEQYADYRNAARAAPDARSGRFAVPTSAAHDE